MAGRPRTGSTPARPPDPARRWTAEVRWAHDPDGPHFAVVARDDDVGEEALLMESPALPWPPSDRDEVDRLTAAADDLTRAVVHAGWAPLARGDAWYARRFAWEPRGRFSRRPWPEDAEALWRCEIRWCPGATRSRFEVLAQPPRAGRRRAVAASEPLTWLPDAGPEAAGDGVEPAVAGLRELLLDDGWTAVGPGRRWYAHRFVWRRDGDPPHHLHPSARRPSRAP